MVKKIEHPPNKDRTVLSRWVVQRVSFQYNIDTKLEEWNILCIGFLQRVHFKMSQHITC